MKCAGLPTEKCPYDARGPDVKFGYADLDLCKHCETIRKEINGVIPATDMSRKYRQKFGNSDDKSSGKEIEDVNNDTCVKQKLRPSTSTSTVTVDRAPGSQNREGTTTSEGKGDRTEALTGITSGIIGDAIVQPVLSYMVYALQSGSVTNIKNAMMGHFTLEQICEAKDILWSHCSADTLGEKQARKDSSARTAKEAHVSDIMNAWAKLDKIESTPTVLMNCLSLYLIPRSHPEELNNISMVDRLNRIEHRMDEVITLLDQTVAENSLLKDRLDIISSSITGSYANALKPTKTSDIKATPPTNSGKTRSNDRSSGVATPLTGSTQSIKTSVQKDHEELSDLIQTDSLPHIPDPQIETISTGVLEGEFQLPTSQRKRIGRAQRRHTVILGTANSEMSKIKGAPGPSRDFFIFRLEKTTSQEDLGAYLNEKDINVQLIQEVSHPDSKFKSFKLSVCVSEVSKILNPDIWPQGVGVHRFRTASKEKKST